MCRAVTRAAVEQFTRALGQPESLALNLKNSSGGSLELAVAPQTPALMIHSTVSVEGATISVPLLGCAAARGEAEFSERGRD